MPENRDGPPRPPLTRDRITAAAVALADAHGMERLTMRALAARLGVEAMSLYNHVRNKEDLIDAVVEAVIARIDLPRAGGDWRAENCRRALSMRAVFLAHPWAPHLIAGRINLGPNMLALVEATLGCLHSAGFTYAQADHVWNALDSHIYGFHMLEHGFPLAPDNYAEAARAYLPALSAERYPHLHALARLVAEKTHDGVNNFAFGLDLELEALEAWRIRVHLMKRTPNPRLL